MVCPDAELDAIKYRLFPGGAGSVGGMKHLRREPVPHVEENNIQK